jgi:ATPase subunit of ABC transporter with duplicated ATPase domains|eukprot:SAG25_NODE_430_length_8134_cov_59.362290_6_plen_161_part_00
MAAQRQLVVAMFSAGAWVLCLRRVASSMVSSTGSNAGIRGHQTGAGLAADAGASATAAREHKKQRRAEHLELRRLARNRLRSKRGRQNRSKRQALERVERERILAALSPEERERAIAEAQARLVAGRTAQDQRLREAFTSGAQLCIDLSYDTEMSAKENR